MLTVVRSEGSVEDEGEEDVWPDGVVTPLAAGDDIQVLKEWRYEVLLNDVVVCMDARVRVQGLVDESDCKV